jgi:eukaryotic-like serine/threonine-protein kinase
VAVPSPANLQTALADLYTIEQLIGAGGTASVYRAVDRRHRRQVAVKVLRPDLAAALGAERFLREIETSANLRHPHIVPLYDSGEAGGFLYYVMPLVEGESLRARLDREPQLPVDVALAITREVASALGHAHDRHVLHRDVKPENILLENGHAVVVDFGIARAIGEAGDTETDGLTRPGLALGTPQYMSPEQAVGEKDLDGRSDLYSLACVLFEMLAGRPPFEGPTFARLSYLHLMETPPAIEPLRPGVPAAVASALRRALAKAPGDRFPTMAAFVAALEQPVIQQAAQRSVAVLPFLSLSADPENDYFADGMTEDVIAQLSKIHSLRVVSRTSVMPFRKREGGLREIASRLAVGALVDGSVRRAGGRVRIVAQLIDAASDTPVWSETYDRDLTDIFAIQTEVALHIAAALEAELSPDERGRLQRQPTTNSRAYQLYLQGRHHLIRFTTESVTRSIDYFERAIERDRAYAPAWTGLAMAFMELGENGALNPDVAYPRVRSAVAEALALDPESSDAHTYAAFGKLVYEFDWAGAEAGFKRALELSPGNADAWDLYGRLCSATGRFDEAVEMTRRAQELDPLTHRLDLATAFLRAGRYDEALETVERALEFEPHEPRGHATLGWIHILKGRHPEGTAELERAVELSSGHPGWLGQLGQAYGAAGMTDRARAVLGQMTDQSRTRYVSPYHLAFAYIGVGRNDDAMDCLERAFEERSGAVYGIKGSFLFASLRTHPRFQALVRRMNLTA